MRPNRVWNVVNIGPTAAKVNVVCTTIRVCPASKSFSISIIELGFSFLSVSNSNFTSFNWFRGRTFPNCTFGDSCLFVHPNCKFDSSCTRKSCPFNHPMRVKNQHFIPVVAAPAKPRPTVAIDKTKCKFYPLCNNVSCPYFHPLVSYGKINQFFLNRFKISS